MTIPIPSQPGVRIAVDRGGTFTDIYASIPRSSWPSPSDELIGNATIIPASSDDDDRVQVNLKLLSVDPQNYSDAPAEGIRRIMSMIQGRVLPHDEKIDTTGVDFVRMGTTVATNALLERKGVPFGLLITRGFKDLLEVGDQKRPDLFDLSISNKAKMLYDRDHVIEVDERVTPEGYTYDPQAKSAQDLLALASTRDEPGEVVVGVNGQAVRVLEPLDETTLRKDLKALYDKGIRGLAVVFLQSANYPEHERRAEAIARDIGFTHISLSSSISSTPKVVPRGHSAAMDAYVSPILTQYIQSFESKFARGLAGDRCDFMKSDGGLVASNKFTGVRALLSGPAGGVVGCAITAYSSSRRRPVVAFDMGGTSTDVSRYNGVYETKYESVTAGQRVAVPQLSIETVAAGGGSRLFYKNDLFVVGPESVGAHPGPACYRKGGELAITDANLVLGRLVPEEFPAIFGPGANEPLDRTASLVKFEALAAAINESLPPAKNYTVDQVAAGFIKVANEGMSRPMQTVTQQRGFAPAAHDLCCFGGAGAQHACAIAKGLGISTVIIPAFSSILSAYGIACAEISAEAKEPFVGAVKETSLRKDLALRIVKLRERVLAELHDQGVDVGTAQLTVSYGCHYDGSDTILEISESKDVEAEFIEAHFRETSFRMGRRVLYASVMVSGRGTSKGGVIDNPDFAEELVQARTAAVTVESARTVSAYFDHEHGGRRSDVPFHRLSDLPQGAAIQGPAILADMTQTIVVEPECVARILKKHVIIDVGAACGATTSANGHASHADFHVNGDGHGDSELTPDPVTLAVFANRFMSIAEQMGVLFERTSISLSIKERLDFSCSIHTGDDGGLVANAPHIPIHLGSMADAVRNQHEMWKGRLEPGDVLLTNHPDLGGTHLPDITVVTPIFDPQDATKVLFYMASRGHHSDIGGSGVTSMNPVAKLLWEEGMVVKTLKMVRAGVFDEETVTQLFMQAGEHPGCSATRRLDHNLTDLRAAVSANQRGATLMQGLFQEFGTGKVLFYMRHIQRIAAKTIRQFLRETFDGFGGKPLEAEDYYDDGTLVKLKITIDREEGNAVFDWTGTGPQTHGNFNVPISISYAAIIYCLRCMISPEVPMPLNQGVLEPITNIVPPGCILNPTGGVAVSGSTVASQRVIDTILKAFEAVAAFQGDANSLGFGTGGKDAFGNVKPGWAYGEAIGGGTGAGEGWHGKHVTSCHSTNTRITDIEVIESRLPLLVETYGIRRGSGGAGKWRGGDGAIRTFRARENVNVSIVSQRRVFAPYGLKGGQPGGKGRNLLYRNMPDGSVAVVSLGGNGMSSMAKGDRVQIETPGGGGWGVEG